MANIEAGEDPALQSVADAINVDSWVVVCTGFSPSYQSAGAERDDRSGAKWNVTADGTVAPFTPPPLTG